MGRKEARDIAFKIVYQLEFQEQEVEQLLNNTIEEEQITNKAILEYINTVVRGIVENKELIESKISGSLKEDWTINRISKINIAILKVATYELMYMEETVPNKVAINEALELTALYGDEADKPFINGVLANILKGKNND